MIILLNHFTFEYKFTSRYMLLQVKLQFFRCSLVIVHMLALTVEFLQIFFKECLKNEQFIHITNYYEWMCSKQKCDFQIQKQYCE